MKSKLIYDEGEKTFALVFERGDEVAQGLLTFAKQHHLAAARFTAIGAFERVTLGFFELERKDYKKIAVNEQVEVLSLVGDITLSEKGEPQVHAHVVVGKSDGTAHGGHLLEAYVQPTLEALVIESPRHLQRKMNLEVGLALIEL